MGVMRHVLKARKQTHLLESLLYFLGLGLMIMVIKIRIGLAMMIEIISGDGLMTNVDSDGDDECCGVIT